MSAIDRHQLNKLLAKCAGVDVHEYIVPGEIDQGFVDSRYWIIQDEDGGIDDLWDPPIDAYQMELVKVGLRKAGVHMVYAWDGKHHHWDLIPQRGKPVAARGVHEIEALGLAIQAMEADT